MVNPKSKTCLLNLMNNLKPL